MHANPHEVANPFYLMAPSWALIPLVILATLVTVIASQAVITGAFSIAQQAMSLGLLPRMNITHTSDTEQGQIYIGQVNWLIFAGVIGGLLAFGLVGLFVGPVVLAVTYTQLAAWVSEGAREREASSAAS